MFLAQKVGRKIEEIIYGGKYTTMISEDHVCVWCARERRMIRLS